MNRKYYKRFQIITPYFLFLFIIFNHVTTHATDEHEHHKHQLSHHHNRLDNPYADQNLQDLYDMMAKMKFRGSVTIVNNLLKPVAISFKIRDDQEHDPFSFVTAIRTSIEDRVEDLADIIEGLFKGHKDKGHAPESKKGTIAPHHMLAANDFNPDVYMIAIKDGTAAINLMCITKTELKLSIEARETQKALFPLPLREFDFHPHLFQNIDDLPAWIQKRGHEVKPFGPKYPPEPNQSDDKFRKDFDSHLNFMNMLAAPGEGIKDATEIYKKRAELFAQHSLIAHLERPLSEFKGQKPKIPLITHTIFLTTPTILKKCLNGTSSGCSKRQPF